MKKIILVIIAVAILGAGGWYLMKNIKEKKSMEAIRLEEEKKQNEEELRKNESQSAPTILSLGQVEGSSESEASGVVSVVTLQDHNFVSFGEDFKVGDCSDPFLFLGKNGAHDPEARLGLMTSNTKSQNYEIPPGLDVSKFDEIWVICQSTSKPLGHVKLISNEVEK